MNPYEVLGVAPTATMAEIEARYRLLLREYHPDVHHHEGPDAVAAAETTTRQLNSAMAMIRRDTTRRPSSPTGPGWGWDGAGARGEPRQSQWVGDNPFWRPPDENPGSTYRDARDDPYDSPPVNDWFGNPIEHHPSEPVPCPFCGRGYQRLDDYEHHLQSVHRFRQTPVKPHVHRGWFVTTLGKLRYIPAWLVVLIAFANWRMFGFYVFTGSLVVVAVILWTQTSPRFRNY